MWLVFVLNVCAMWGITRIKSGVLLLPVQMWTGLGETVMQHLQADPPAMKSSADFHSAHFHSSPPFPKNTQKMSMLWLKSSKFSKSTVFCYYIELHPGKFLRSLGTRNLFLKKNKWRHMETQTERRPKDPFSTGKPHVRSGWGSQNNKV